MNIKRRIERLIKRVKAIREAHKKYDDGKHHPEYHAGWTLGYWEGRLSAFEDMNEEEETNETKTNQPN